MKRLMVWGLVVAAVMATPVAAQHEPGRLAAARNLYASARYEEALDLLNALRGEAQTDRKAVETYRSLCLLALGRGPEAERAIAAVVMADPAYRPDETEASPRVRATFADVRRRMLPEIATSRYVGAKAAYDRREWAEAEEQFRLLLALLDDPDMAEGQADLRLLATGFLELSARASLPTAPAPEAPPAPVEQTPDAPDLAVLAPDRMPDRIYDAADADVAPPTVLRQDLPSVPRGVTATARARGLLDIVIDEKGRVVSMSIRESIHPTYDTQVLAAARNWKYEPATLHGQPVRFRKLIQIAVAR